MTGAGARKAGVVEGVLERRELLVLVVAIDGDLLDQAVEVGIGPAGWTHGRTGLLVIAVRRLG